jgi:large subunit ribosomal protein L9
MEVLLATHIESLGKIGDVVKVRSGYARNYLFPRGLARPVTKENLARIQRDRKRYEEEEQGRIASLKDLATRIGQSSVTIAAKASPEGHLFGSVNAAMIATELEKAGLPITAVMVKLEHPIKQISVVNVPVHLHKDVHTEVRVFVVQARE